MSQAKNIDKHAIEQAIREIIIALGENPDREGLIETPKRVAKAYEEMFDGIHYTNEELAKMYDKGFTDCDLEQNQAGLESLYWCKILQPIAFVNTTFYQ